MAEISVIVPVYRVEAWLAQCVDSIRNQRFRDWELILVDDGSPDGCGKLCDAYARRDSRIRVIHQENRGVSAARNAGLDLASGRFVTFCDGDDFWYPEHLERLRAAADNTGADLVYSNYRVISEAGEPIRATAFPAGVTELPGEEDRLHYIISKVLAGETGWAVWNRLFCRELLTGIRFCADSGYGEDLAFLLEYLLGCRRIAALPQATCCYRLRGGSATDRYGYGARLSDLVKAVRHLHRPWLALAESGKQFPLVFYGFLKETLEALPARQLPGILDDLPEKAWFTEQMAAYLRVAPRREKALARFCIHRRVWQYRLERRIYGRN